MTLNRKEKVNWRLLKYPKKKRSRKDNDLTLKGISI